MLFHLQQEFSASLSGSSGLSMTIASVTRHHGGGKPLDRLSQLERMGRRRFSGRPRVSFGFSCFFTYDTASCLLNAMFCMSLHKKTSMLRSLCNGRLFYSTPVCHIYSLKVIIVCRRFFLKEFFQVVFEGDLI